MPLGAGDDDDLPGYRVLGTLGTGAASTIYEVLDRSDGKRYALKHLHKRSASDQRFVEQAVNEHEIAKQLDSPLLRKSYKLIRRRSMLRVTSIMLVMELVEGKTLADARPSSMTEMIRVLKGVARATAYMHRQGIVHADLKPINVMITDGGGLKIIDFGQSCRIGTVKDRIQGTIDYIAPEQLYRGPITPLTDIYNLGALMFWCVTGQPVPRATREDGTKSKLRAAGSSEMPDARTLNPATPAALATLIRDCLLKEPSFRPADIEQVRARLNMALYQSQRADGDNIPESVPGEGA